MTKHEKRLEKARNNPKDVSYEDFVSILEKEGYTIHEAKGSHRKAIRVFDDKKFLIIFAQPHGNKKSVNATAVKDMLLQLDEVADMEESEDNE